MRFCRSEAFVLATYVLRIINCFTLLSPEFWAQKLLHSLLVLSATLDH
jgi:hypothetical protein